MHCFIHAQIELLYFFFNQLFLKYNMFSFLLRKYLNENAIENCDLPCTISVTCVCVPSMRITDPLQALEFFKHNSGTITLVLLDIRMLQMNGYELVTKIKELQPKVKVILMSAFEINDKEFLRMLPSVEIGLISKPISMKIS